MHGVYGETKFSKWEWKISSFVCKLHFLNSSSYSGSTPIYKDSQEKLNFLYIESVACLK